MSLPVQLLDRMCWSLPHIWGQVSCSLLDGQHHNGDNNGDADTGQNPQSTSPDELVWVLAQKQIVSETVCHNKNSASQHQEKSWEKWDIYHPLIINTFIYPHPERLNVTLRARWNVLIDSNAKSCCFSAYLTRYTYTSFLSCEEQWHQKQQ